MFELPNTTETRAGEYGMHDGLWTQLSYDNDNITTNINIGGCYLNQYLDRIQLKVQSSIYNKIWNDVVQSWSSNPDPKAATKRKRRRLREIMKSRCFPGILIKNPSRRPLPSPEDIREQRARETLRRIIGEKLWTQFLRKGFIQVRGKSGRYYQIFPSKNFTKVFQDGTLIERLCVVLKGNFPPTDSLIVRYLMILNDEENFWSVAIKQGKKGLYPAQTNNQSTLPLTEIYRNYILLKQ